MKNYYTIIRYTNTETEWLVNVEEVATIYATWTEAVKQAKAQYTVRRTDKRRGVIVVA